MSAAPEGSIFESAVERYDAMVNWPRRLAHETPFYKRLFRSSSGDRVLDVACGTGHHAALFHSWGLDVTGADLSAEMIETSRARHGENERLRWVVRSFDQPPEHAGTFDNVVCVGNSLAICADQIQVATVIAQMLAAVRPGGLCMVQVLNLWRLEEGPTIWQKCLRQTMRGRDTLLLKGIHRAGGVGYVEFVEVDLSSDPPQELTSTAVVRGIEADELRRAVQQGGGGDTRFYGGYNDEPYVREESADLIMVCRRGD